MQATIERLRKSKIQHQDSDYQKGLVAGAKWAKERAEYDELERLSAFSEKTEDVWATAGWADANEAATQTYRAMKADHDAPRGIVMAEWNDMLTTMMPSVSMVRGFVDGALDVFAKVEDEI